MRLQAFIAAFALAGLSARGAPASATPSFADLADLTLAAPMIVRATITGAEHIADRDSPGLAPGFSRQLINARLDGVLIAPGAVPAELKWLWDAPADPRGKSPKPKGSVVLAWLAKASADGKTQLISGLAQQPYDAVTEAAVRAIASEARSGNTPAITGVSNGFRADGTVAGESESQFFLIAADAKAMTMVVTAKPGLPRRVTISRGDIIDESAAPVQKQTLLWYHLACGLPARLPAAAGGNDQLLAADWKEALASLGPCDRSR